MHPHFKAATELAKCHGGQVREPRDEKSETSGPAKHKTQEAVFPDKKTGELTTELTTDRDGVESELDAAKKYFKSLNDGRTYEKEKHCVVNYGYPRRRRRKVLVEDYWLIEIRNEDYWFNGEFYFPARRSTTPCGDDAATTTDVTGRMA